MVRNRLDVRVSGNGPTHVSTEDTEPGIGELLKQISSDASHLVKAELDLAKAELRDNVAVVSKNATRIGIAAGLALAGLLALTAAAAVALGDALDNYWLGSLIVAVVLLGFGGLLMKGAIGAIRKHGLAPKQTAETIREDVAWAKQEANEVKRVMRA